MVSWDFIERRRKWTIAKIAEGNGITDADLFKLWCIERKISPPSDEKLGEYFSKKVEPVVVKGPVVIEKPKLDAEEKEEKPKSPKRRTRRRKKEADKENEPTGTD
jgi:hypothetical protein